MIAGRLIGPRYTEIRHNWSYRGAGQTELNVTIALCFLQGKTFEVEAGSLVFSVLIYSIFAIICIGVLLLRRYVGSHKGELGGLKTPKMLTCAFFIFLWCLYILLSVLEVYKVIKVSF